MRTRLALIVVLCLGLVACGGGDEEGTGLSSGSTTGDGSTDDDATDQGSTDDADTTGTDDADTTGSDDIGPDTKGSCKSAEDCLLGFGQDNPCAPYACEEGWCLQTSLEEGADCDDDDACTVNTTCQAGQCAGDDLKCDDADDCTADTCDFKEGCQNTPYKDGTSCEDGSECTKNDKCNNGQCKGGKNTCVEDCGNEKDDNENELIDCADPQCMGSLECPTECEAIAPIACGETVTVEIGGEDSTTNVGMWACSFEAWNGPESAWKFSWPNPADVTVTAKGTPDGIQLMRADDPADIGCLPAFCTEAHASELTFSSDPSSSYWIIVESDGQTTGSFQLEVACQECVPDCTGKTCGGDGCNGSCGSCSGGKVCASGACVLKPDNESCEQSTVLDPAVGFPIIAAGTTAGASAGYDLAPTSGCDGSANDGFGLGAADVVYSFTPTVTQEYLIAVNADFDTAFGIFTDCSELKKTCVAAGNTPGYGVEKVTKQLNKGYTYFIIVDGYTAGKSGSFDLTITPWPCTPDCSGKECGPDGCGDTCGECNGLLCTNAGQCATQANNINCESAYNVTTVPFNINHDSGAATDDFEVFPEVCPGGPLISKAGAGAPNLVYKFKAPSGGKYQAAATPDGGFNALLSVLEACPPTFQDCVGASDSNGAESVEFVLATGEIVWIVVDGSDAGDSGQFGLSINKVACTPQCDGKVCGKNGCGGSCGSCKFAEKCTALQTCVPTPSNDSCDNALVIGDLPYDMAGNNSGANNTYQVGASECPGGPSAAIYGKGPDMSYVYTSPIDQSVLFTFDKNQTLFLNTFLYAVSDCNDIAGSCLQAQYSPLSGGESLIIEMKKDQTVYVIVDGFGANSTGDFVFHAEKFE